MGVCNNGGQGSQRDAVPGASEHVIIPNQNMLDIQSFTEQKSDDLQSLGEVP